MPVSCGKPSLEGLSIRCIVSDDEVVHRDPLTAILLKKAYHCWGSIDISDLHPLPELHGYALTGPNEGMISRVLTQVKYLLLVAGYVR